MKNTPLHLLEDFCLEARIKNYRPSTIQWYRSALKQFLAHFPKREIRTVKDITYERLRRYLYDKRLGGWEASTFSNQYRALKAFLKWAVKEDHLHVNPIDGIERPRLEKKLPRRITLQEARRVLEFAFYGPAIYKFERYRNRAMLGIMLYAGLRSAETLNLLVTDVDLTNAVIHVNCGKGAKDRVVPMSSTLRQYLLEYQRDRERMGKQSVFLFTPVQRDQRLSKGGLRRMIDRTRKKSGVNFSAHKLRHTFATLMLEGGCDLFSLQKMMGHSNIQTTTIYLSASAEMLQAQIAKHPLDVASGRAGVRPGHLWN